MKSCRLSILTVVLLPAIALGDDLSAQANAILKQNCASCHGAAKISKLDVRTRESLLIGGERGPALEPGNAEASRLYRFAAGLDKPSMPPGKSIGDEKLAVLKRWIDAGAQLDASAPQAKEDAAVALAKLEERPITPQERAYWAFQPPHRATPPALAKNPVDAFLLAAMRDKHVTPAPPADKRTLVRRAYLDLTGLPPTPQQVQAFLADRSPTAFSRLVDQLLASPQYGERWGRHWLDTVRYADSGGFEYDNDRPQAWRYRDYVIKAFQDDKPYNRFILEQLAGDEMAPHSNEAHIATGYLRLGLENNLKTEQTRLDELDDLVSTTSQAFLGMTVGCARCHNHKFDPIPQKDYYRLQAVFFPTKAQEYPLVSAEEVARNSAAQKAISDQQTPWKQKIKELEKPYRERIMADKKAKLADYIQVALRTPPEQRTPGQKLNAEQVEKTLGVDEDELIGALSSDDKAQRGEWLKQIAALDKQRPVLPVAMAITDVGPDAPPSYFLHRGSAGQKGSVMQPGVLSVASNGEWNFPAPPPDARTSWRRRGLAEWIASDTNPLTARVMVNRIWQQHFGEGIVRTPNNFGKTGEQPTNQPLLDWLATEFVRQGWSIKAMHRLIMNSQTYQRASNDLAANMKADPENRLLWRMPRRRMEAEAIRDSMMAAAGNLDLTVGGPATHPYIDPALFQSSSKRTWHGQPDTDPSTWRRSVYVFSKRSIPLPMLDVFDKPDSVSSCARRNRSTIAPQALIMMNNNFVLMEAQMFADRLKREAGNDAKAQARRAFEIALGRPPAPVEAAQTVAFIQAGPHGLVDFCQTLFNLNEFVYLP